MFKKMVKDLLDKKVLFYYKENGEEFQVVAVDRNTRMSEYTFSKYNICKTLCPGNPLYLEDFFAQFLYSSTYLESNQEAQVIRIHEPLELLSALAREDIPNLQNDVEELKEQLFLF